MNRTPTDDERERLPPIRGDWLSHGLSTDRADRKKTESAVLCEHPTKFEVDGKRVTIEFRDGWRVG